MSQQVKSNHRRSSEFGSCLTEAALLTALIASIAVASLKATQAPVALSLVRGSYAFDGISLPTTFNLTGGGACNNCAE